MYNVLIVVLSQINQVSLQVNSFIDEVESYQKMYPWLLLISMPKITLISSILTEDSPEVLQIMCEIAHIIKPMTDYEAFSNIVEVHYTIAKITCTTNHSKQCYHSICLRAHSNVLFNKHF